MAAFHEKRRSLRGSRRPLHRSFTAVCRHGRRGCCGRYSAGPRAANERAAGEDGGRARGHAAGTHPKTPNARQPPHQQGARGAATPEFLVLGADAGIPPPPGPDRESPPKPPTARPKRGHYAPPKPPNKHGLGCHMRGGSRGRRVDLLGRGRCPFFAICFFKVEMPKSGHRLAARWSPCVDVSRCEP